MKEQDRAIILAAGFGERTNTLLGAVPKALIETSDGKTILEHELQDLIDYGFGYITIVTNNRYYNTIKNHIAQNTLFEHVRILNNGKDEAKDRLGALGDLMLVLETDRVADEEMIVVLPSDTTYWRSFSLGDFLSFAQTHKGEFVTVVTDLKDQEKIRKQLGCAVVDSQGQVVEFEEKPSEPKSTLACVAMYVYYPKHVAYLRQFKTEGKNLNSPSNIIPYLLENDIKVYAYIASGSIIDANGPEEIHDAYQY